MVYKVRDLKLKKKYINIYIYKSRFNLSQAELWGKGGSLI